MIQFRRPPVCGDQGGHPPHVRGQAAQRGRARGAASEVQQVLQQEADPAAGRGARGEHPDRAEGGRGERACAHYIFKLGAQLILNLQINFT